MNYGKKGIRARQKKLNSKSMKWGKKIALTFIKVLLIGFIALAIVGVSGGIGLFKGIIATVENVDSKDLAPSGFSTFVYDNQGNQISKLVASNSNRISVTMDNVPENLANAFVAIEDQRFYQHNGIDIQGLLRAGFQFLKTGGEETQGASTITQQLIKNTIFTDWVNEDSMLEKIERKIKEQYLALEYSKILTKEQVLESYMNTINLGQNTLGIQAASYRYFNKPVSELNLSECATIAGITQNPSKYNPISHPDKNADRRKRVLNKMLELGYINQVEYDEALADNVYERIQMVNIEVENSSVNSYFVDALTEEVYDDLIEAGYSATLASSLMYSGGLKIMSTLDPDIQAIADESFSNPDNFPIATKWQLSFELTVKTKNGEYVNYSREMLSTWFKENVNKDFNLIFTSQEDGYAAVEQYKEAVLAETDTLIDEKITFAVQPQMSLTIQDQYTGYVVAMIGGRGAKEGSRTLNRATSAYRSPGSCFKVLSTYAPAFDTSAMTLATVINDAPFAYDDGKLVSNWYKKTGYRGLCTLRQGIYDSLNIVTVKALTIITPQLGYDYLVDFGFTSLNPKADPYQSMALGGLSKGVSNIELNAAYATIANGGVYNKPKLYTQVIDSNGKVILDNTERESHQVLKETTAFLLTSAMVDVVTKGTGGAVNFPGMAIAGKTGTTSDTRDVWFAGFTPYYTATVWTGYDNQTPLDERSSNPESSLSKKLWRDVMSKIHANLPNQAFPVPNGIVQVQICSRSGKLPIEGLCDHTLYTEYFQEENQPTDFCDIHYTGAVCAYSGLPACADCPFKINGTLELTPVEHPALISGSTIITENEDGTVSVTTPNISNNCPHDTTFFENPDCFSIIEQQRAELYSRGYNFY